MLHCERIPVSVVNFYRTTVGFSSAVLIQVALLYFSRPLNDRSGSYKTTTNQNKIICITLSTQNLTNMDSTS